jgi:hypothetical protein
MQMNSTGLSPDRRPDDPYCESCLAELRLPAQRRSDPAHEHAEWNGLSSRSRLLRPDEMSDRTFAILGVFIGRVFL